MWTCSAAVGCLLAFACASDDDSSAEKDSGAKQDDREADAAQTDDAEPSDDADDETASDETTDDAQSDDTQSDDEPSDDERTDDADAPDASSDTDDEPSSTLDASAEIADEDASPLSDDETASDEPEAGPNVEPNVTPDEGGEIMSADGLVLLTVPPGAVDEPVAISVERADDSAPEEIFEDGVVFAAYDLQPSGLQFDVPATVSITLTDEEMASIEPDALELRAIALLGEDGELDGPSEVEIHGSPSGAVVLRGEVEHFSWLFVTPVGVEIRLSPKEVDTYAPDSWSVTATLESSRVGGRLGRNMARFELPNPPVIDVKSRVDWETTGFPLPESQQSEMSTDQVQSGATATTSASFQCDVPGSGSIQSEVSVEVRNPFGAGGGRPEYMYFLKRTVPVDIDGFMMLEDQARVYFQMPTDIPVECACGLSENSCLPKSFNAEECECFCDPERVQCSEGQTLNEETCECECTLQCDPPQVLDEANCQCVEPCGNGQLDDFELCDPAATPTGCYPDEQCNSECDCECLLTEDDCEAGQVLDDYYCECVPKVHCPPIGGFYFLGQLSLRSDQYGHRPYDNIPENTDIMIGWERLDGTVTSPGLPSQDIPAMSGTISDDPVNGCTIDASGMGSFAGFANSVCLLNLVILNDFITGILECTPSAYPNQPISYDAEGTLDLGN
jgi:hypothetical protein